MRPSIMKIVDIDKLKKEMDRRMDIRDAHQSLVDFPLVERMLTNQLVPFCVDDLEDLSKEIHDLLINLHEMCNGYISTDTPLYLEYEPDPESDLSTPVAVPYLTTTDPESLGAWKSRLKLLRTNLHFDPDAIAVIDKKLEELYELKSL